MIIYPKTYFNSIKDIDLKFLKKNDLKGLLLDVDNTIIDYNKNILEGAEIWVKELKKNGIKLCILSNSNKINKVEMVAKKLNIPFIFFAKKPLKSGFKKGAKILRIRK